MKRSLVEVDISALGVIEKARFAPGAGLTVITGETGAGKTMVLSALSLLMGSRADSSVVRAGSDRAHVVGRFAITQEIARDIGELGGEVEGGEALLARTVTSEGKSRASIGGVSTTISALSEIGAELLSIHGQSAHFTLLKPQRAREILDQFGGAEEIGQPLKTFQDFFTRYRQVSVAIRELEELQSTRERELERINLFLEEFDRVKPTPRESALLREKILSLENVDTTRAAFASSLDALTENEMSVSSQIASVKRALDTLSSESVSTQSGAALAREISILVNELATLLRKEEEELDVEPGALERMHDRRALVQNFVKRFGDSKLDDPESALIEEAVRNRTLFAQLSGGDQGIAELKLEREALAREVITASRQLNAKRIIVAKKLESAITDELTHLAMPGASIVISITQIDEGVVVGQSGDDAGRTGSLICSPNGSDEVEFLLIAHPGAAPLPINKGASGGELSRIMLAIEVTLAGGSSIPTYVFDEVDVGVGGKAAVEVGRRLALLARHAQVLVVTHLPQVAAWADTHFMILKSSTESVTSSDLVLLEGGERAKELARMMAGREESPLAREHAQELLDFVALERSRSSGKKSGSGKRA